MRTRIPSTGAATGLLALSLTIAAIAAASEEVVFDSFEVYERR